MFNMPATFNNNMTCEQERQGQWENQQPKQQQPQPQWVGQQQQQWTGEQQQQWVQRQQQPQPQWVQKQQHQQPQQWTGEQQQQWVQRQQQHQQPQQQQWVKEQKEFPVMGELMGHITQWGPINTQFKREQQIQGQQYPIEHIQGKQYPVQQFQGQQQQQQPRQQFEGKQCPVQQFPVEHIQGQQYPVEQQQRQQFQGEQYPVEHIQGKQYPVEHIQGKQFQGEQYPVRQHQQTVEGSRYQYTIDLEQAVVDFAGHKLNGQVVYPTAGFMYLVWNTLAKLNGFESVEQMPIKFEDIEIIRQFVLRREQGKFINFIVEIKPTGEFRIIEEGQVIVLGRVHVPTTTNMFTQVQRQQFVDMLEKEEIYRQMQLNNYKLNGEYQTIIRANKNGQYGELLWANKWISFIQGMIQMYTLNKLTGEYMPTGIQTITIDPLFHLKQHRQFQQNGLFTFPCVLDNYKKTVQCGGIQIQRINMKPTTFNRQYQQFQGQQQQRQFQGEQYPVRQHQQEQQVFGQFVQQQERQTEQEYVLVDKLNALTVLEQQQEQQLILDEIKRQNEKKQQKQIYKQLKQQLKQQLPEQFERQLLNTTYEQVMPRTQSLEFIRRQSPLNVVEPIRQQFRPVYELVSRIIAGKQQWRHEQTLEELNLDQLILAEVQEILSQWYKIQLTLREVRQLTLERLRIIEQNFEQKFDTLNQEPSSEYRMRMINHLQKMRLMPTQTIQKLNNIEYVSHKQITPMFVIHPIAEELTTLKNWAKQMNVPVYALQYTHEAMRFETVEELTQFYWSKIQQELLNNEFTMRMMPHIHIVAYTFGAPVAREFALRFPQQVATLSFLGQQDMEKFINFDQYYVNNTMTKLNRECEALYWFVQQYTQLKEHRQFVEELMKMTTTEQRIRYTIRVLMTESRFQLDFTDVEQALYAFLKKVNLLVKYNPTQSLKIKQVLLITPRQQQINQYFIKQNFNGKLQVETVEGDLKSFFKGQRGEQVARLLNEFFYRYL